MGKYFSKAAFGAGAIAMLAMGSLIGTTGAANAVACNGLQLSAGTNVGSCTDAGGIVYDFTDLTFSGPNNSGDMLTIQNSATNPDDLVFQTTLGGLPTDIFLQYSATGAALSGVDASFGSVGSTLSLQETVCKADIPLTPGSSGCPGGPSDQLAFIPLTTGGTNVSETFAPQSEILISKDVDNVNGFSDFEDSIETPEPVTISLFGAGLAGIGFGVRRRKKAPAA